MFLLTKNFVFRVVNEIVVFKLYLLNLLVKYSTTEYTVKLAVSAKKRV